MTAPLLALEAVTVDRGGARVLDGISLTIAQGEFLGLVLIFAGFLVSEEVFRNVRLGATLWSRAPAASLEREVG